MSIVAENESADLSLDKPVNGVSAISFAPIKIKWRWRNTHVKQAFKGDVYLI